MSFAPTVYERASAPAKACQPGALAFLAACRHVGPSLQTVTHGCWNDRNIAGTATLSLHAEGRAVDIMCPSAQTVDDTDRIVDAICDGDAWAELGVQLVIWWGRVWRFDRGWRPYSGAAGPHKDHAHVELIRAAAQGLRTDDAVRALRAGMLGEVPIGPPIEPPPIPLLPAEDEMVKALALYRDKRFHNVWLIGGAQALHVGPALREHYVALGVPEVVDQHDPTLESILWQSGTPRASLVAA